MPVAATPAIPARPTSFHHRRDPEPDTGLGYAPVTASRITLDQAVDLTRLGDVWIFRGQTLADRAIQLTTNSPVNHVGMAVTLDDLPPLMWHAELGKSLPDLWTGTHQRGVQLHDLREAVLTWAGRYGQRAWLRQLVVDPQARPRRELEDATLRSIARLDGTPFPRTARLAGRWFTGRLAHQASFRNPLRDKLLDRFRRSGGEAARDARPAPGGAASSGRPGTPHGSLETAFCAEVVALTYAEMGLLEHARKPNFYDPGAFWSGDDLELSLGARLGAEIEVWIDESLLAAYRRPAVTPVSAPHQNPPSGD